MADLNQAFRQERRVSKVLQCSSESSVSVNLNADLPVNIAGPVNIRSTREISSAAAENPLVMLHSRDMSTPLPPVTTVVFALGSMLAALQGAPCTVVNCSRRDCRVIVYSHYLSFELLHLHNEANTTHYNYQNDL